MTEKEKRAAYSRAWYAKKRAEGMPPRKSGRARVACAGGCGKGIEDRGPVPEGGRRCHECRKKPRLDAECAGCSGVFTKMVTSDRKYCSRTCYQAAWSTAVDTTPRVPRVCVGCGTDVRSTANVPRCQPCLEAWRLTPEFRAPRNRIWRDKNRRRQALKLGLPTERYTTEEIAERDGFICGLCEEPVDMTLSGRNLRGPTIDHIIPISKGGPDTRVNVQLAHLRCNIIKGNRSRS